MKADDGVPRYRQAELSASVRVEDLLDRMTVAEKAGQLVGTWGGQQYWYNDLEDVERAVRDHHVGSAAPFGWGGSLTSDVGEAIEIANHLQRVATEETRLGIPLLLNTDATHGHAYVAGATVFPNALGMAATWDPALAERAARITAREVRLTGAHQNYAPTCDVARDPRWGRTFETYGESPALASRMVAAAVRGLQGGGLDEPTAVVATAKHFPAYGEPERGEDAAPVDVSEYKLRNTFVPPFEAAIDAGVSGIMPSYNSINGLPSHAAKPVLRTLLRDDLGFDGHVATDWNGIRHLDDDHGTAADRRDAVRQAFAAGVDLASVGDVGHADHLVGLVEDGAISEERLDESVRRVLRLKVDLGLFEDPYVDPAAAREALACESHRAVARDSVRQSLTLLENDGLLPLDGDEDVFVGGPNAHDLVHQLGGWSVTDPEGVPGDTILEALVRRADGTVTYEQGATLDEPLDVDAAVEKAADADVAVLAVGEGWYLHEFGPAADLGVETGAWPTRSELGLSDAQHDLVRAVHATGTPVVAVLVTGRPLAVDWLAEHVPAILMAYFPGIEGGTAVAEALYGDTDPSGRLPISVPRAAGDLPQLHDHLAQPHPIGEAEHPDSYDPLYPFGHGLSYTDFAYDDLRAGVSDLDDPGSDTRPVRADGATTGSAQTDEAATDEAATDEAATADEDTADGDTDGADTDGAPAAEADDAVVEVSVTVRNAGDRAGTETVQVYARPETSTRVQPTRRLVGFDRVHLDAGEEATVTLELPADRFGYYRPGTGHVVEPGTYHLHVADDTATVELPYRQ